MPAKYNYDAIIIGAGISGLVCGCYLAKAGLKTLIVEKNAKPGGYCTSFRRNGFSFDACVHALSSLRKEGILNKIITELGVIDRLKFSRHNPSDVIVTPDFKINMFHEIDRTIDEFQKYFPEEKSNIAKFFNYIASKETSSTLRNKTFADLLNSFFSNKKLKNILSFVILMCLGLPSNEASALVSCLLYREFMFDGGYYPIGGVQLFPDVLLERYTEFKGESIFGKMVKKIDVDNNNARGIFLDDNKYISSKYIISASDSKQTFFDFIEDDKVDSIAKNKINSLVPSSSFFLVYWGVSKKLKNINELKSNIFLITDYENKIDYNDPFSCQNVIIHTPSVWDETLNSDGQESICTAINVGSLDKNYWNKEIKEELSNKLVKLSGMVIPDAASSIILKMVATPVTFYDWTRNCNGAAFGWASTINQFGNPDISQKTKIKNLYVTGHWCNQSSGVSLVANCGRDTAGYVIKEGKR